MNEPRILVVEDDPYIARAIGVTLSNEGYAVTTAGDGLAAIRAFDDGGIALTTVDLMLPKISGFRLVQYFKRARPDIPLVVVSSLAFEEAEEVARAGADDFVSKPFSLQSLVGTIRYQLSSRPRAPLTTPSRLEHRGLVRPSAADAFHAGRRAIA